MGSVMDSTTDAPPPKLTGTFVYMGLEFYADGQRERWARVIPESLDGIPQTDLTGLWRAGKARKNVGSMYAFQYTLNEKGLLDTITFPRDLSQSITGNWPNRSQVRDWVFNNETALMAERMDKIGRKNMEQFESMLIPIQTSYLKARTRREKAAILALVIRIVTGG